ncbi:MAG: hypothetical protein AAF724_06655 [Pseudomonadota bacterium]
MREKHHSSHAGLAWPKDYRGLLPILKQEWGIDQNIYLTRKLSGGKSGALVYSVDISSESFKGQAILKLDLAADPGGQEELEAALHERAIEDAPDFAAKHLPRVLHSLHHGDQVAILSNIAGRGLEYAEPWVDCWHDRQLDVVRQVSAGLLNDWNADYQLKEGMNMPQDLLQSWLGHRLEPEKGGRIHGFLQTGCGIAADAPSIIFDGHWYPNPLAFATGVRQLPERLLMRGVTGHCHCDFHGLNLLVGRQDGPDQGYYLIDLAMYESQQYLFYDHAYFELARLLFSRGGASAEDWNAIVFQLGRYKHDEDPYRLRTDDIGLIELVRAMRQGVKDWIETNEAERLSFMENQTLLARVAVGLNFAHKNLSPELRQMAFYYAAANLKDFLKLNRVDWPKAGPGFRIGGAVAEASNIEFPAEPANLAGQSGYQSPPNPAGGTVMETETKTVEQSHSFGRLFYELRRRNVVRVAGLYAVVAWLCIQVVTAMQPALQLPEWSVAFSAMILAVGFPIACIVAWAFELSASGLQRTSPGDGTYDRDRLKVVVDYGVIAGIIIIIALSGRDLLPWQPTETSPVTPASAPVPVQPEGTALAVLPFSNLNANGDDSFADGLTIEIFHVLAQTRAFRIPGITSAFQYKNAPEDLRSIGRALDVDYLVEGTVRRDGDNIRIEANLVRAEDGFLIWSDSYRETMENVFVAQENIAREIGTALSTPLDIDSDVLEAQRTDDPRAYEFFVRGIALLEQRGEALKDGMRSLELATSRQPNFAAAWGALSLTYNFIPTYVTQVEGEPVRPEVFYRKARESALKAREIDADLPIVRHALGNMYQRDRQWAAAEAEYKSALLNDPNDHRVMLGYAGLMQSVGKHALAFDYISQARDIDPLNVQYRMWAAFLGWHNEPSEQTIQAIETIFRDTPSFRQIALRLIISHRVRTGELDKVYALIESCEDCSEALRSRTILMLDESKEQQPEAFFEEFKDDNILGYRLLYSVGGEALVLQGFEYIGLEAKRRLLFFTVPWRLIDIVGDSDSFKSTVTDMGLVNYWREHGWGDYCRPTAGDDFVCAPKAS